MAFNIAMSKINADAELISALGGPAKVAELLGIEKRGGIQRVHNWMARGIPAAIKVSRPDLFIPGMKAKRKAAAPQ